MKTPSILVRLTQFFTSFGAWLDDNLDEEKDANNFLGIKMDEPRAAVFTARTVMIAQASLGIFVISIILCMEAVALKEKFHKLTARKRTDRAIVYLMGMSLFSIGVYIISMSMYSNDWRGNPGGCQIAGQPFLPLCFVIAKQFMYYFLYERASIVLDTLKMNDRIFTLLRRIIVVAIIVGIP